MSVIKSSAAISAIVGTYTLLLTFFIIMVLYIGQAILIPLALGVLLTFMLSPFVTKIERWIGRVPAVLITAIIIFMGLSITGYILTREFIDLTTKLPNYKNNIEVKLRSIHLPYIEGSAGLWEMIHQLEKNFKDFNHTPIPADPNPVATKTAETTEAAVPSTASIDTPLPVEVVETKSYVKQTAQSILGPILSFMTSIGIVMLIVIFMLVYREDLRGRILRIVGLGNIGMSTRAMDDAGQRISHYLFIQLIINSIYGVIVTIGLYIIGIPNAELWGGLAIVLRFIPYIGSWISAVIPIALSLIISENWLSPFLTIGLYMLLDLLTSNIIEPWLYGSSTGVSSIALILAAIFWTMLWGPVGLFLSTPLTVCLVVIGQHVQKLGFLSVLFSDEQALELHEECYHRLLRDGESHVMEVVDNYLKDNSLTLLYDSVLIPVIQDIDADLRLEVIDKDKAKDLYQSIGDIIEDLNALPVLPVFDERNKLETAVIPDPACRVICVPARGERDVIVGNMLAQVLTQKSFLVENMPLKFSADKIIDYVEKNIPAVVCISVVAPSKIIYVRFLCKKLRMRMPKLKIIVGLWGSSDITLGLGQKLQAIGVDEAVTTLQENVEKVEKIRDSTIANQ